MRILIEREHSFPSKMNTTAGLQILFAARLRSLMAKAGLARNPGFCGRRAMRGDGLVLPVAARSAPPTSIRHGFLFLIAVPDG